MKINMVPRKITKDYLEDKIQSVEFKLDETKDKKWCICVLTVENGFKIIGEAHRQFSTDHVETVAKSSAYSEALDNMWGYYTFLSHVFYAGTLAPQIEVEDEDLGEEKHLGNMTIKEMRDSWDKYQKKTDN